MSEQEMQMKLALQQGKVEALRQEVAEMNKEREYWQQVHIQAAIAAMQGMLSSKETMESITRQAEKHNISVQTALAVLSVNDADALVEELKRRQNERSRNIK